MNNTKTKKIVFVGGETAGPIMPLLVLAQAWQKDDSNMEPLFLDIKKSVASRVVPSKGFKFKSIRAGKLRRYVSVRNMLSPLLIIIGFIQSLFFLARNKPLVVVGAGGYVQVPVMLAAFVLRIPRVIHQQDIIPTFSNRICNPLANKITTTFEKSVKDFPQGIGFEKDYSNFKKVTWTGNPTDLDLNKVKDAEKNAALNHFKLEKDWPTVLVVGGGSGARGLNAAVAHNLPDLLKTAQVLHSTGPGKRINVDVDIEHGHDRYHQFEFISQIDQAYVAADVVISRAGIGAITALSALGKLSIIVPMPDSHQEWNAKYLYDNNAAIVLDERDITPDTLTKAVKKILFDADLQKEMQKNIRAIMPPNATHNMLEVIKKVIHDGK